MSIWLIADLAVLGLIGALGYFSMKRGFLKSSYNSISTFAALILVFSFHTPFQGFLEQSAVGDTVREKIRTSIETSLYANPDIDTNNADSQTAIEVVESLRLPQFLTDWLTDMVKNQSEGYHQLKSNLVDSITDLAFPAVMQVLSVILLYLIIKILIWIFFWILKFVTEIPLISSVDRLLGAMIGGVNALLIIYIVSGLLMLLVPVGSTAGMERGINSTMIYKYFYYNNLLINLFFK